MTSVTTNGYIITSISKELTGTLVVEEKYDDVEVKAIASSACVGGKIEELDLSKTKIESIGTSAFSGCGRLTVIHFSESLQSIAENAFLRCGFKELYITKNLVEFDGYAFNQSPDINNIEVDPENQKLYSKERCLFRKEDSFLIMTPRNITSTKEIPDFDKIKGIGGFAFTSCIIQSFIGTEQMTALSEFSFHSMYYISLVDLSRTKISEIPSNAFSYCSARRIMLPHSIKSIGEQSFVYATRLVSLEFQYPLEKIGEKSFVECRNLRSIYYLGATNFSAVNMFSKDAKTRVYVMNFYKGELFGGLSVSRNWIHKTCYCKIQKKSSIYSYIFLVVMIEK